MWLSKIAAIESNLNPQFVIATFELLKEKTLSRITTFSKHTSLDISLTEKLNYSFFFPQTSFRSKTQKSGGHGLSSCGLCSPLLVATQ